MTQLTQPFRARPLLSPLEAHDLPASIAFTGQLSCAIGAAYGALGIYLTATSSVAAPGLVTALDGIVMVLVATWARSTAQLLAPVAEAASLDAEHAAELQKRLRRVHEIQRAFVGGALALLTVLLGMSFVSLV